MAAAFRAAILLSALAAAGGPVAAAGLPAPNLPQILRVELSARLVHPGDVVTATVHTTAEVVSVVAVVPTARVSLKRIASGLFRGAATVPSLPFFVRGKYDVTFVAKAANGGATQSAVTVTLP